MNTHTKLLNCNTVLGVSALSKEEVGDLTFPESKDLVQTNAGESTIPDAQITIPMELLLDRFNGGKCMYVLVYLHVCMYVCMCVHACVSM